MDYKEKYKEALERARGLHEQGMMSERIEYIFPELKESEDERIRKEIIQSIQDNMCIIHKDKCIAWLEKRGEQKSVPDWMTKFLDELRTKKNYFDWDEHKDIEGGILAIINWMNPTYFNEKEGGQEPIEWSGKIGVKHAEGKLKEMLDRKENSAWGEEDDEKINELCSFVYENYRAEEASDRIAWLKSIKDRYTWKPSDNELEVLRLAAEKDGACLMGLYEQLKKLKAL